MIIGLTGTLGSGKGTVVDFLVEKGFKFETETDTEVIVRLVEDRFKKSKNILKAVFKWI